MDFNPPVASHEEAVAVDGLEHIFRWASEMVADGEDARVKMAREKRVRRQVLEVVQKVREQKIIQQATDENLYLQRRVIALLQKLQEVTEENSIIKSTLVSQYYALQRIPALEEEVRQLKSLEFEKEAAVTERRYLMDALARVKADRDYIEEVLTISEEENARLARILSETRAELEQHKSKRWWHIFRLEKWIKKPA